MENICKFDEFVNEGFKDLFKKVKDNVDDSSKKDDIKIGDKKVSMEDVTAAIRKYLHPEVIFIKNITELVNKDKDNFKENIVPILRKWAENKDDNGEFEFDDYIGNSDCTKYIKKIIEVLVNDYGWDELMDVEAVVYDDSNEEDERDTYFTGFIAYVLLAISEEIK